MYRVSSIYVLLMIQRIPLPTMNAMAAAQIIQRPYNVVKELTENAIDAGATVIHYSLSQGGTRLLQVMDNGTGILSRDFPLLCKRFTTSKLQCITDLSSLMSFGFRGEALASLSHVSDLRITSKHKEEQLGVTCTFKDQELIHPMQQCSMVQGTKISVQNLYLRLQVRKSSLNPNQQKRKIIKLVQHFMLHYPHIQFILQSQKGRQLCSPSNLIPSYKQMTIFQTITDLSYDKFLLATKHTTPLLTIEGILTRLNSCKGKTLLLNVNHRIVEHQRITKCVEKAYSDCYQSIHEDNQSFFAYVSLEVDGKIIDCNQNPSKKMISFIGIDILCKEIYDWVISHVQEQSAVKEINSLFMTRQKSAPYVGIVQRTNTTVQDKNINRTDSKQLPLKMYGEVKSKDKNMLYQVVKSVEINSYNQIKKFFQKVTFVGSFNLNYVFIHKDNTLYLMNIVPYIPTFLESYLKTKELILKQTNIELVFALGRFIEQNKFQIQLSSILNKLKQPQKLKKLKQYGIQIQDNKILSYPILIEQMYLSEQQLCYFLLRFLKQEGPLSYQKYFFDLLSTGFINDSKQLSPFNSMYCDFIGVYVLPFLKSKCVFTQNIEPIMTPMLDLKDVYKIFQRC